MLTSSPEGLSDAALARELGGTEAGFRPQTVNQICRRLAAEGRLERVGSRPIVNRLPPPPPPPKARGGRKATTASRRKKAQPPAPALEPAPAAAEPVAEVAPEPVVEPAPDIAPACGPPPYDALQAWSRVANVHALVAGWLVRRGATLRSASADEHGPARDLVASLDGDDVHVEVTGWPPDGARTHPTTIAGDWFAAAEAAAAARRRAHPRARIVIALPDTRRYRSLTERSASSLEVARAEVWFVDPAGSVHAR